MKQIIGVWLGCLLGCLSGCTGSSDQVMRDASEYSAVSVLNPDFQPGPGTTFAWYSPIIWSSEALPEDAAMKSRITRLVNNEITSRGFRIVTDQAQADYILGGAIVDGQNARSEQLKSFFNLFPALGSSGKLQETTALMGVIERRELARVQSGDRPASMMWRASLSAYVMREKLSPELQDQRLTVFTRKLMRSFPR